MAHPTAGTDTPPATYTPAGVTSRNPTTPGDLPPDQSRDLADGSLGTELRQGDRFESPV